MRQTKLALQQRSAPVHLPGVLLRVDGHSSNPQLGAGSEHADGDLTWKETQQVTIWADIGCEGRKI